MGLILTTRAAWKALKRPLEEVLDAHCLKSRFLKDVPNEITTFGGSLGPYTRLKSLTSPTLRRKCSRFDLHDKKHVIQTMKF